MLKKKTTTMFSKKKKNYYNCYISYTIKNRYHQIDLNNYFLKKSKIPNDNFTVQ